MKNGMLVSSIRKNLNNDIIVSRDFKKYDCDKLNEYIDKFKLHKKKGIIENGNFEDNVWVLYYNDGVIVRRSVNFPFENNKKFNNIIKCYLINLLENFLGINEIADRTKRNNEMIYISNFFNPDNIDEYIDFILNKSENSILSYRDANKEFINFLNENIDINYIEFLDSINIKVEKNTRIIPDYKSVLYFDYGINLFINNSNMDIYNIYIPIVLWWKFSSNIPMRPIEFLKLRKDCVFSENGKYYIRIKRRKPNGFIERATKQTKEQVFRINHELYTLAKKYIKNEKHTSEFFICKNFYNFYQKEEYTISPEQEVFPYHNFNTLLERFYEDVISKQWYVNVINKKEYSCNRTDIKNDIVKLQLGDSRHLAIVNLVLQGTNSYLIKEMAGHRDINSHLHYINHAREYVSSKVIVLTDILKYELSSIEENKKNVFIVGNKRNEKIQKNCSGKLMKVGKYFCKAYEGKEELFPYICIESKCKDCNYSILDIENVSIEEMENEILFSKTEVEKYIDIMKCYVNDVDIKSVIDTRREKYLFYSQQSIKEAANKIEYFSYREAELQAYKFKKQLIDVDGKYSE